MPERNDKRPGPPISRDVLRELERIDEDFLRGMPQDARLESGVPEDQRVNDFDFVRMVGLARPQDMSQPASRTLSSNAGNPSADLSFFERGVTDVGAAMTPAALEAGSDDVIVPEKKTSSAMAELRDIIADLSGDAATTGKQTRTGMTVEIAPPDESVASPDAEVAARMKSAEEFITELEAQPRDTSGVDEFGIADMEDLSE